MVNPERTPGNGTNPEIPSMKQPAAEKPIKPEMAELMDELETTPSMIEEDQVVPAEKPKSTTEQVISLLYEELGQAKQERQAAPDGTPLIVLPEERIALAIDVRDRANQLVRILKQTGAEEGSVQEQMELERAEIAAKDAENLAAVLATIKGVDHASPAVKEKLAKINAEYTAREQVLHEEAKQNAAAYEAKSKAAYEALKDNSAAQSLLNKAVPGAQLRSISEKNAPSPFESSLPAPDEPTGVKEFVVPLHAEDADIVGSAEDFDELAAELVKVESALASLPPEGLERSALLEELLQETNELTSRTTKAAQLEGPKEERVATPEFADFRDLDMRATRLLFAVKRALPPEHPDAIMPSMSPASETGRPLQPKPTDAQVAASDRIAARMPRRKKLTAETVVPGEDVFEPVPEHDTLVTPAPTRTEKTIVQADISTRIKDTNMEPLSEVGSIDLVGDTQVESFPEPTVMNAAQVAMTENASREMTAVDQDERIGGTEVEPNTVVTPRVPEASIASTEPTRITAKPEKTLVTPAPTFEEPPTDQEKAA